MFNLSSFSVVVVAALFPLMPAPASAREVLERATLENSPESGARDKKLTEAYPEYFTINTNSIKVTLLQVTEEPGMNYVELQAQPDKSFADVLVTIDNIVNVASKIWQIVKENAPTANFETKYATAYPQGVTTASQLSRWSKPKSYVYGFYAENIYGSVMIDCKYKFSFIYNGSYKGKGKYLTGVTVVPTMAEVGWGYTLGLSASVPDSTIANVGTDADPVAAMQLKLKWKMSTALKETTGTSVYYIQGDGFFEEIANPWSNKELKLQNIKAAAPLLDPAHVF